MRSLLIAVTATAIGPALAAQTVPTGFVVDNLVTSGLNVPNDCCFLPDGRCLIANSAGSVALYVGGVGVAGGNWEFDERAAKEAAESLV